MMRLAGMAAAVMFGARAVAQDTVAEPPATPRQVSGRVLVQRDSAPAPVVGTWVTLHRVAEDSSGPLDSTRTDARGGFSFRYRARGSDEAIYFVSTRYGGVAYFTRPLRAAVVTGQDAAIDVFDTTSAAIPATVRGRHLIVSGASPNGTRDVIEVFELSNDTSVTRIERPGTNAGVWSTPVPTAARRFEVRAGEVPADALVLAANRAVLHMPLAPGIKQIAFSYTVSEADFPLSVTAEGATAVLEVLVEDARGSASGGRLIAVAPVVVEGRSFKRFLAQDVPPGTRIVVDVPRAQPAWVRWIVPGVLALVGVGMLGALLWSWRRRAPRRAGSVTRPTRAVPAPAPSVSHADVIAREIAALDDAFAEIEAPDAETRDTYERDRALLKARLAAVLAAPTAPR
jgi:hypothetical protein